MKLRILNFILLTKKIADYDYTQIKMDNTFFSLH